MATRPKQTRTFLLFCFFNLGLLLAHDEEEDQGVSRTAYSSGVQPRKRSCDVSNGKWVYDQSYPLYDSSCPYLSTAVACRRNGRPDSDYEKWKWKPHGCSVQRFHALAFLGKMRRKRMMLVGDSIMRNQWESLVCLVQAVVPTARKRLTYNGPSMAFHALDYDASIEFTWAPLLVELKKEGGNRRMLHLDLIEDNARFWRGVDVLVFDSAHWWTHSHNSTSWDYLKEGMAVLKSMDPMVAYEKGLTTWARWVDLNLDPRTTRVIFRSMSPRHNRQNGWKCYNQREPLKALSHRYVAEQMLVLKGVLGRMRFPVYLQDITAMTTLRRDGHPSVYRHHPSDFSSDCSHWCLPGVPDIWNELFSELL